MKLAKIVKNNCLDEINLESFLKIITSVSVKPFILFACATPKCEVVNLRETAPDKTALSQTEHTQLLVNVQ